MIIDRNSIKFINDKLKLPATGTEQDWEIELADFSRINEFIEFYNQSIFSDNDKIAMMALILASYEDYLYKNVENIDIEDILEGLLLERKELFFNLLNYWALSEENSSENWFKLTIFARNILKKY